MNTEFFLLTLHQIYLKDNNKQKKIITNNILIENKSFGILSSIKNNNVNYIFYNRFLFILSTIN